MTKSRNLRPPRQFWSAEQLELLHKYYPDTRTCDLVDLIGRPRNSIYAKASELNLAKSAAFLSSPACGRTSGNQGKGTRFTKGHITWNKGKKTKSRDGGTRFKKGQMPHNWHPIGHEGLTGDGYLRRKMTDTGCTRRDYVHVHILLWTEHNGAVPKGHCVIFKDGNKANIAIENLDCISRADNMKRNSYHNYPKELATLVQLRSALNRQINKREKNHDATE